MNCLQTVIKITSRDNKQYKEALKLQTPQGRRKSQSFLIEGFKLGQEALKAGLSISKVFVTQTKSKSDFDKQERLLEKLNNADIYFLDDSLFKALSQASSPEPILMLASQPKKQFLMGSPLLLLDGLQDPGNVGTIARSARAFGFSGILFLNGSVSPFHPKALRASMGAVFTMPFATMDQAMWGRIKSEGYKVYAADIDGSCFEKISFSGKSLLIIGNEANGLSELAQSFADVKITIPMESECESLNAGVAASILMQRIYSSLKAQ